MNKMLSIKEFSEDREVKKAVAKFNKAVNPITKGGVDEAVTAYLKILREDVLRIDAALTGDVKAGLHTAMGFSYRNLNSQENLDRLFLGRVYDPKYDEFHLVKREDKEQFDLLIANIGGHASVEHAPAEARNALKEQWRKMMSRGLG